MPIYAYRCTSCGAEPEYIQKFSDPPMEVCEACGGSLTRQITAAAFHLKGGGWYKDGYASSKPKEAGESTPKDGGGSGGESKASSPATESSKASTPSKPAESTKKAAST